MEKICKSFAQLVGSRSVCVWYDLPVVASAILREEKKSGVSRSTLGDKGVTIWVS